MAEITIDADICKKDGLCALTCTRTVFQQEEKDTIPKIVDPEAYYR
jgi:NAD-dependent dihydropyrimidine dehydrogenase PreA subunit